jgi:hypothetical protein
MKKVEGSAKSDKLSNKAAKKPAQSKKKAEQPVPVSRREASLRQKLSELDADLSEQRTKIAKESKRKSERLETKITKARQRQEKKLARLDKSKLYKNNRLLYILCSPLFAIGRFFRFIWRKIMNHHDELQTRRPHRSFYLTPRAKSRRGIKMKGYLGFTHEVGSLLWKNKWLFIKFTILYAIFSAIIVGLLSQENFAALRDALNQAPDLGFFSKYSALFSGALTGGVGTSDSGQQIISIIIFVYGWLTLIWLLRRLLNGEGKKLKLRDGLYNGGGSVLSILVILIFVVLQLLPFALVLLAYSSVTAVGWINQGIAIENMAAWCVLMIAGVMTLYWICSSFISLVIVTLPGIYPRAAMKAAGDLVTSRRVQLVLRLLMMAVPIALLWLAILTPAILLDGWLFSMNIVWVPVVPLAVLILMTLTIIWCAAYIYMLYRKMVDDPTPPLLSDWQMRRAERRELRAKQKAETKKRKNDVKRKSSKKSKKEK